MSPESLLEELKEAVFKEIEELDDSHFFVSINRREHGYIYSKTISYNDKGKEALALCLKKVLNQYRFGLIIRK